MWIVEAEVHSAPPDAIGQVDFRFCYTQRVSQNRNSNRPPDDDGLRSIPRAPVFHGVAADAKLQQLGVPGRFPLQQAVLVGNASANNTTDDHPPAYPGDKMWGETTAELRSMLRVHGFERRRFRGLDLTVSTSSGLAIVVTAGGQGTGNKLYNPNVRYKRGDVLRDIINGGSDSMFDLDEEGERPDWDIFFLLHHRTTKGTASAELSRPIAINKRRTVTTWDLRILLDIDDPDDDKELRRPADDEIGPVGPVVQVKRRAAG